MAVACFGDSDLEIVHRHGVRTDIRGRRQGAHPPASRIEAPGAPSGPWFQSQPGERSASHRLRARCAEAASDQDLYGPEPAPVQGFQQSGRLESGRVPDLSSILPVGGAPVGRECPGGSGGGWPMTRAQIACASRRHHHPLRRCRRHPTSEYGNDRVGTGPGGRRQVRILPPPSVDR